MYFHKLIFFNLQSYPRTNIFVLYINKKKVFSSETHFVSNQ